MRENFNLNFFRFYIQSANNNAVFRWLQDLRFMSENECLCVLQAKSLATKFVINFILTHFYKKYNNANIIIRIEIKRCQAKYSE